MLSTFARLLREQGKDESAEKYYKATVESDPLDTYARITYARFLWSLGRVPEALNQLESVLKLGSSSSDALGLFVTYCRQTKQGHRAIERVKEAIEVNPGDTLARDLLINSLLEEGQIQDAVEQARIAVLVNPKNSLLRRKYAETLLQIGNFEEAAKQLSIFLELSKGALSDCLLLLKLASEINRTDWIDISRQKIIRLFRYSLQTNELAKALPPPLEVDENLLLADMKASPDDIVPRLIYARYLIDHNRQEEAEALLKKPCLEEEDEQFRLRALVTFLQHRERFEEVESLLRETMQRWPSALWPHIILMAKLKSQDKQEELDREVEFVSEHFPSYVHGRLANVNRLLKEDNTKEAEEELKELIQIAPRNPGLRSKYATLLIKDRPDEAEIHLKKILRLNPQDVGARRRLINLLSARGAKQEIDNHIKFLQTLDISPPSLSKAPGFLDHPKFQQSEEELLKALQKVPTATGFLARYIKLLELDNRLDEARKAIEQSLEFRSPPRASLRRLYASFLDRIGEQKEAEAQFKLALEEHPKKPGNYISYALFLDRQGRQPEALKLLSDGRQLSYLVLNPKRLTAMAGMAHDSGNLSRAQDYYRLSLLEVNP